ncbi:hypothetical protein CC80DRAFT_425498 [Byssothecium circinans]|uniref:NACHT domain-containing protein n=1 Tax=Byssothecium circinans TaxID=147558 RepID=A0A6A5TH53_9PLEO|nr:hypothetical protein CC80DRAFT_425498 [Byssothecium circinans]
MNVTNVSQAISLAKWTIVFYLILTGGTIVASLWLLWTLAHADAARQRRPERSLPQTHRAQDPTPSARRGPYLRQVHPTNDDLGEGAPSSDIDIIAIHGLDTNSPDTWKWRVPSNRKTGPGTEVNWLANPDMLPMVTEKARIFTCDWPADLRQQSSVPTTLDECAQFLRDSIVQHLKENERKPVLFIASCLGGIILIKALVMDNQRATDNTDSPSLTKATRGVVFLATPFRGTAFKNMPSFLLKALSFLQDHTVTALIDYALGATPDLDELTKGFITLTKNHRYDVFMFWEAQNTVLLRKFHLAWIVSRWILTAWLLVNKHSATLSDFHSQRLNRPHVMMNKFAHSECTSECKKGCKESNDFHHVSGKIVDMLKKICEGSPLEQADAWIRTKHYTADRLKIERLSGDLLPLERCYINLAIVEVPKKTAQHAEKRPEEGAVPHTSPFSLAARLKAETPNQTIQMELASLFDPRKNSNGETVIPRRILIRGRAGVGKTTLCKKIVNEFASPSEDFRKWNELFDRVLWVPLRRLKEWQASQYDLEEIFCHEFFARKEDREMRTVLAKEMQRVVEKGRTLFILDGMDEIAQELTGEGNKSEFLQTLLNQPNAIITSRSHVSLPKNVRVPDLELETIGFYPDQVGAYLEATFTNPKKVEDVQSYLQAHQLIQGLVRIPIQLDALCYTWDSFHGKAVPQTITAIYRVIEESLWKKDIVRLEKKMDGKLVTEDDFKDMDTDLIKDLVNAEIYFLEGLAFTGLRNDVINFGLEHRKAIFKEFKLSNRSIPWARTLPRLSFLRTSEPSEEDDKRDYHFLHLTFQEYFAARYFVRHWRAEEPRPPLNCLQLSTGKCDMVEPTTFLQEHKYDPRYDIFWRFVVGLLDANGEALGFFEAIEQEPRDLLGPTHQRLVMHCLSEVERKEVTFTELRMKLEKQLEEWLLFECNWRKDCQLAREIECPEQVLVDVLKQASEDARLILLECLDSRAAVPFSVINVAIPWLEDSDSKRLCIAILRILRHQHKPMQDSMLQGIVSRLDDEDGDVQQAAIEALQSQANLTEKGLQSIIACFEDKARLVQIGVFQALKSRADLTNDMLNFIKERLQDEEGYEAMKRIEKLVEDERGYIQIAAIEALQGRADLTHNTLKCIENRLWDDKKYVQKAAIEALQGRADLTKEAMKRIEKLVGDESGYIQIAAIKALQGRADLTNDTLERIEDLLSHEDRDVRRAAIEAFQGRANLTEKALQGIIKLLNDEVDFVQEAAVDALEGRTNLTEKVLQDITAQLRNEDWYTRVLTIHLLKGQANLKKEVLQSIAEQLGDEDQGIRQAAAEALVTQAALSLEVLGPYVKALYTALLQRGFEDHLYWYASDRVFIGVGLRHVSLSCDQKDQPSTEIWEIRKHLGVPLPTSYDII